MLSRTETVYRTQSSSMFAAGFFWLWLGRRSKLPHVPSACHFASFKLLTPVNKRDPLYVIVSWKGTFLCRAGDFKEEDFVSSRAGELLSPPGLNSL